MMPDEDDSAQYAALEKEMSSPAGDLAGFDEAAPITPEIPRQPTEEYTPAKHGGGEGQQQQPPPQQNQQQQQHNVPSAEDDPIAHFSARAERAENVIGRMADHMQQREFWDTIRTHENQARAEIGEDYDQACDFLRARREAELATQFPDRSHEAQVVAHRHGFANAEQLRAAILQRDVVEVANHAFANNISPATSYYNLALQRGFKPKVTVAKSQEAAVANAMRDASEADADKIWDWYRTQMMRADEV